MSWRQIHDSVAYSNSLARLSDAAERLFWRLLAQSDAWGRLPGEPSKVRALCVPIVGWSDEHIADLLDELEREERIAIYGAPNHVGSGANTVGSTPNSNREYIVILDFEEHQPRSARRRGRSKFPDPPFPLQTSTPNYVDTTPNMVDTSPNDVGSTPPERERERERERESRAKGIRKTSSSAQSKNVTARPESLTAQEFVGFLVDEAARLHAPLTKSSKGQAARLIAGLVAAGASGEALRTGITRMIERGRPISALTDIVREAAVAPAAEPEVDYPPLPPVAYDWVEPS